MEWKKKWVRGKKNREGKNASGERGIKWWNGKGEVKGRGENAFVSESENAISQYIGRGEEKF